MEAVFSRVCRVSDERLLGIAKPGIVEIPADLLPPRQVLLGDEVTDVPAVLKQHRGQLITTISRQVADDLVKEGKAEHLPQKLLSFTHSDYVADGDVKDDAEEIKRVEGHDLVVVAVIGDNRSALAVCRNIVSGCQDIQRLINDAKGALEASRIVLIED